MDDLEQFEHLRCDGQETGLWAELVKAFRSPPPPPPFVEDVTLLFEELADGWVDGWVEET